MKLVTSFNLRAAPLFTSPFELGALVNGYSALATGDTGSLFTIIAREGAVWEIRKNCVYDHGTLSFSRGVLVSSSTSEAVSFTSAAIITASSLGAWVEEVLINENILSPAEIVAVKLLIGATALSSAEVSAVQALVSGDGVLGIGGREQTFDGAPIPDPRNRAGMSGLFATQSTSSGYLEPTYSRRIVVTLDISATTSGVTAAGGQDLTLFPTATAAGFRWDEPNRSFRFATSQANNSLAVITIKEA